MKLPSIDGERVEARSHYDGENPFLIYTARSMTVNNPLIGAAHLAFAHHLPLALSPDVIWLVIMQGVSQHINHNSERFRGILVPHDEKKTLTVIRDGLVKGRTTAEDWKSVTDEFVCKLLETSSSEGMRRALATSFSTTACTERIALNMTMMDTLKSYFTYQVMTRCDIPVVDIRGRVEDWVRIRDALGILDELGLVEYKARIDSILDHFIAAYGEANRDDTFWNGVYNENGGMGSGDVTRVSGWLKDFFLYTNDEILAPHESPSPNEFPSGVSSTPFVWEYLGAKLQMRFASGLVGVEIQRDGTLSPQLGWAVFET
jgi:hypothetical protein